MDITIFSDNVAPYRMDWASELARNHNVTFVYFKDKDNERNDSWLVKSSNTVKMIKLKSVIIHNRPISFAVIKMLKKNKDGIVIFDGYGLIPNMLGIWYMKRQKKPYFINIDGIHIGKENRLNLLKKSFFSQYCYVLCGSEFSMQWLCKLGVAEEKIVVHNFSSIKSKDILDQQISNYDRENNRRKLHLGKLPLILGVGRFLDWKQFDLLIKAFKPFDTQAQLVIVGEGKEKEKYYGIIEKEKVQNVRILDFMPYNQLVNYYKAANLFVLPSNGEVWGLVVNEAISFGLPVITSDTCVSGKALIKEGFNGYTFHYNDINDLSRKISLVLSQTEQMGSNGLTIIKNFTIENMAKVHEKLFAKLTLEGIIGQ